VVLVVAEEEEERQGGGEGEGGEGSSSFDAYACIAAAVRAAGVASVVGAGEGDVVVGVGVGDGDVGVGVGDGDVGAGAIDGAGAGAGATVDAGMRDSVKRPKRPELIAAAPPFSVWTEFTVPTDKRSNTRDECHRSHTCKSFKRAGVGTNGILECKFLSKNARRTTI
jgi:hypothetical protein